MIVCEVSSWLLCGTSPPREATVKHEIMGRVQISHDDGKEQLQTLYVVQLQEQQHTRRSVMKTFALGIKKSHLCTTIKKHLSITNNECIKSNN